MRPLYGYKSPTGIYGIRKFQTKCSVGSTFWTIEGRPGRGPIEVIGPCTITQFKPKDHDLEVCYTLPSGEPGSMLRADLLNSLHGVFLTAAAANQHYREWQAICSDDPAYRKAVRRDHAFTRGA